MVSLRVGGQAASRVQVVERIGDRLGFLTTRGALYRGS